MTTRHFRSAGLIAVAAASCCCLFLISAGAGADQSSVVSASPLAPQAASEAFVTPASLDLGSYEELKDRRELTLTDFALGGGVLVELELDQFEVFAPDATILASSAAGDVPLDRPNVALFRGQVVGDARSHVFVSVSPYGVSALIQTDDATHVISSGPPGAQLATVVYNLTTLPAGAINWRPFHCAADELGMPSPGIMGETFAANGGDGGRGGRDAPCRVAQYAIETDWEFTGDLFGGDTEASGAYAATLFGAASEIFTRDANTRLEICFLRIWSDSNDPWDAPNIMSQLDQFREYWNDNMTHVDRNAVHLLSGRPLGGGVAYIAALCYPEYDYGLSSSLNGWFPYPLQDNHEQNWDPFVVSHELGHNFGSWHTHDMVPPIDECAYGDCSVCPNGTIMSYCHQCEGGLTNILLEFHDRIIDEAILPFLSDPNTVALCDITVEEVTITDDPDDALACEQGSASFTVVAAGYEPLSHQWRKDGVEIPGADQDSYVIGSVTFDDAGDYDVVVSNTCGSMTSTAATLIVCPSIPGDLNHDCDVDLQDLVTLLGNYGATSGASYEDGDLDDDGDIDLADLAELLGHYSSEGC